VTIFETKGKWKERQKFSLNLQTQGVQMDHPQTQRMHLRKRRQDKSKEEEKNQKKVISPVWSLILLSNNR
jgi:hypothetical protein